jgi:hypothetical protein
MSQDSTSRAAHYDELLRRFASGVRAAQLYAAEHPLLGRNVDGLVAALRALHQQAPAVAIGIVGTQLVVADTPMPKASAGMTELIKRLRDHGIEASSASPSTAVSLPTKSAPSFMQWRC